MKNIDITDELLYKYMPIADEKEIAESEALSDEEEITLSPKFEKRMKRLLWREKHKWIAEFGKFMIKVAVVCLCILGVGFAVTMSVDAYRSKFFQTVQELLGDSALHTYDANETAQEFEPHEPTYIPEGYVEVSRDENTYYIGIEYIYSDESYIYYEQKFIEQDSWSALDTEYENQIIKKTEEGLIIVNQYEGGFSIAYYETKRYVYILTSDELNIDEIYKICGSIE